MYILKHIPEDFRVEEMSTLFFPDLASSGPFLYFKLIKKNMNTLDAVSRIARSVGLEPTDIGFAGAKDKCAVTIQYCSARGGRKERFENLNLPDISVEVMGFGKNPISLGDLSGNKFEIIIRNLQIAAVGSISYGDDIYGKVIYREVIRPIVRWVNYFDDQRFSENNPAIGKHILRGEYVEAARLVNAWGVQDVLTASPRDGVGALRRVPLRLLRMYVHSYQSLLWNRVVSKLIEMHLAKSQVIEEGWMLRFVEIGCEKLCLPFFDLPNVSDVSSFTYEVPLIGFTTASADLDPIKKDLL